MRYRIDIGYVKPHSFYVEAPFIECFVDEEIPFVNFSGVLLSFEDDCEVWEVYRSGTTRKIFDSSTWETNPDDPHPFGPDTLEEAAL